MKTIRLTLITVLAITTYMVVFRYSGLTRSPEVRQVSRGPILLVEDAVDSPSNLSRRGVALVKVAVTHGLNCNHRVLRFAVQPRTVSEVVPLTHGCEVGRFGPKLPEPYRYLDLSEQSYLTISMDGAGFVARSRVWKLAVQLAKVFGIDVNSGIQIYADEFHYHSKLDLLLPMPRGDFGG